MEQQVSIGIRFEEEGVESFGHEEVNRLIEQGYRVIRIEPGEALVEEVDSDDEEDAYVLAGCQMVVVLQEPTRP